MFTLLEGLHITFDIKNFSEYGQIHHYLLDYFLIIKLVFQIV